MRSVCVSNHWINSCASVVIYILTNGSELGKNFLINRMCGELINISIQEMIKKYSVVWDRILDNGQLYDDYIKDWNDDILEMYSFIKKN